MRRARVVRIGHPDRLPHPSSSPGVVDGYLVAGARVAGARATATVTGSTATRAAVSAAAATRAAVSAARVAGRAVGTTVPGPGRGRWLGRLLPRAVWASTGLGPVVRHERVVQVERADQV